MNARVMLVVLALSAADPWPLDAQSQSTPFRPAGPIPANPTPEDVYRAACMTCHGVDGKGGSKAASATCRCPTSPTARSRRPSPIPTGRPSSTKADRSAASTSHMPAFGDALSAEEIGLAVRHLRTFCTEPAWPRGDLNLPRAFFTEKAFPENEAVWTTGVHAAPTGSRSATTWSTSAASARATRSRSSCRSTFSRRRAGSWTRGLGDVAVAFKRAFYASMKTGRIAAAGVEVALPTGKEELGLGNGFTIFEPFAMWGPGAAAQHRSCRCTAASRCRPTQSKGKKEAYLRTAIGTTFAQNRGFGRAWSPQVEVLWARPEGGASEWDVVPQLQVTLSKLQHVMVAGGVRIPLNERDERRRRCSSTSCGTGSTAASSSSGNDAARAVSCALGGRRLAGRVRCSALARRPTTVAAATPRRGAPTLTMFAHSDDCVACHNNLDLAGGRGRLDRRDLARHDDGQLGARSVLAGERAARDDRSPVARGGHRGRVRGVPHADGAADRARGRGQGRGLRAPADRGAPGARHDSTARGRRRLVHRLSSDRAPSGSARARASTATSRCAAASPTASASCSARSQADAGRRTHHALGDRLRAGARRRTSASRSSAPRATR